MKKFDPDNAGWLYIYRDKLEKGDFDDDPDTLKELEELWGMRKGEYTDREINEGLIQNILRKE